MHFVLAFGVLALAGGVVWLLVQRGAMAARLAVAEREVEGERERRARAEEVVEQGRGELERVRGLMGKAQEQAAGLTAALEAGNRARESDSRAADAAKQAACDAIRNELRAQVEGVERERATLEKQLATFETKMKESFESLAGQALKGSSVQFLTLAKEQFEKQRGEAGASLEAREKAVEALVKPIAETLGKTEAKLSEIERTRTATHADLKARIEEMARAGQSLKEETGNLVKALREPQVRGRYGELQLRRVAELAGMRSYCDFGEQDSARDGDGVLQRPDMVVKLPNGREVVVDAKANLKPYLDAIESKEPDVVERSLQAFADGVVEQAKKLAKKNYWKQYDGSPDFVVMFMPAEQLLDAALSRRPDLLESAWGQRVLLVGPGSLIGLLRAVSLGFEERRLSEEAKGMCDLVRELHSRLATALGHADGVGDSLRKANDNWNKFVGSVTDRLGPQIARIEAAAGKIEKEVPVLERVSVPVRMLETRVEVVG